MNFAIAVKAFVVHEGKVLLLQRRKFDAHAGSEWDLPGGRLDAGENPFDGLHRELQEEAGMKAEITAPLDVQHFVRDDGQTITMIIFLCKPKAVDVTLSEEHQQFKWLALNAEASEFPHWILAPLSRCKQHFEI